MTPVSNTLRSHGTMRSRRTVAIHRHSAVTSQASQVVLLLGAGALRSSIIQGARGDAVGGGIALQA